MDLGRSISSIVPAISRARVRGRIEAVSDRVLARVTPRIAALALEAMAWSCRLRPALRGQLSGRHPDGTPYAFDATFEFRTRDGRSRAWARFARGRMKAGVGPLPTNGNGHSARPDVTVTLRDASHMRRFFSPSGADVILDWMLDQHLVCEGNLIKLAKFGSIAAAVALNGTPRRRPADRRWPTDGPSDWQSLRAKRAGEPCPDRAASGASLLDDPALSAWTLDDFPRLKRKLHAHFHTRPSICSERARLWTEAELRERRREPAGPGALRQARIFDHVLRHKRALVWDDDLLLGTTTAHRVGIPIVPEIGGTVIWPELLTMEARPLNPYEISPEEIRVLDQEVFPFWIDENIREHSRAKNDYPECMRLDERWVLYFLWKNHAVSHTIADMPAVLGRGLTEMARAARERAAAEPDAERRATHEASAVCLEAVQAYAARVAEEAEREAAQTGDPARRAELLEMAAAVRHAPAHPARSLREALNAIWICFLSLHQENHTAGMSIGRLDVWLQPFFEREMRAAAGPAEREAVLRRAVELAGAFMLKATDSYPLVADVGNRLFGGSSANPVITLGGVRPDGTSGVCDMTYVLLKVTEMLGLKDPNMNARYCPGVDPEYYLRRLCEVNLITHATPSLHNDRAMLAALQGQGIPLQDARDWGATGCVEPTLCGRHMGHTNSMMFNLVAPLEATLHDGVHPVIGDRVGPRTGDARAFASYEELLAAYKRQLEHLLRLAVEGNNVLGRTHRAVHPSPYLSALLQGPEATGRDVTDGGARYNSSGIAMIGLADVVDSLAAVKTLVFDRQRHSMAAVLDAVEADFVGHETLRAEILARAPKFGGGDAFTAEIAHDLMAFVADVLARCEHYRGGRYWAGYWSMSNHVAFGLLSGALPSGRQKGKPFTPGITPSPLAQASLLDNIRQVAGLRAEHMPNNMAFNVKLSPGGTDTHAQVVDRMTAYARTYFELGGMQLQFNAVSTETLREAMEQPEAYRDLLVRISGYNAYFVDLNRDMQLELIERTEHR